MALLTLKDVTLGYDGMIVTENVNFSIEHGDYLCIVGENGSGKSTLMKTILKLVNPLRGEVLTGDGLKSKEIGYLPQQTVVQRDFPASVNEIVLSGCLNRTGLRPFYTKAEKKLAEENMRKMDILELKDRCYRDLSGGQQQRVLLARALCAAKKMILLDEPVSGLDPKVAREMYELIYRLNKEDGITVVMISHDINEAVRYADKILHIGSQRPLFFGDKADYVKSGIADAFIHTKGAE